MAHISVRGPGEGPEAARGVEARQSFSLLNNLLASGESLPHDCGGRARCGTCRVRVLSGADGLSRPEAAELERLAAVRAGPDERLACRAHAFRDVEIEVVGRAAQSKLSTEME
jgi:adenylate cyclase